MSTTVADSKHAAVLGRVTPDFAQILTPEALAFVAALQRKFDARRKELLARRAARQKEFDSGKLPDFLAETKKVRDDSGYWNSVEHYVTAHTDAQFSHGVCPDCFPKLFPDVPFPDPEEQHV